MMSCHRPATLVAAAAASLLAACTVGPDYVRPTTETPAAYKELGDWRPAQPQDRAQRGKWWEVFGDPELNALEQQVDVSNQNLRIAEAQFRQAQALVAAARSGYFPVVAGSAASTRSRAAATGGSSGPADVSNIHSLSLDASWEADLWGRVRRSVESTESAAQAAAADLESARLSLQAALAQDYFQLRAADSQRRLLDDSVAAYAKSLQLVQNQYAAGVAGRAEIAQAETQLKATMAQAIDIAVLRAQLEHAIAVLVGKPPSEFSIAAAALATTPPPIPVGLPSELLQRRPDIAGAERRVAAANAQIGVAESAFFPSLTLSASAGFRSSALASLLTAPSRFWAVGPALAQLVFDGGLRRAQTDQARAAFDAAVAGYRQSVLSGFQEVEDNLAALRVLEQEAEVQDQAVQAARQSVALTTNQYKAGTVNYLSVVTVQTAALANERSAADILGRRMSAAVLLVKALGGGWHTAELPSPDQFRRAAAARSQGPEQATGGPATAAGTAP